MKHAVRYGVLLFVIVLFFLCCTNIPNNPQNSDEEASLAQPLQNSASSFGYAINLPYGWTASPNPQLSPNGQGVLFKYYLNNLEQGSLERFFIDSSAIGQKIILKIRMALQDRLLLNSEISSFADGFSRHLFEGIEKGSSNSTVVCAYLAGQEVLIQEYCFGVASSATERQSIREAAMSLRYAGSGSRRRHYSGVRFSSEDPNVFWYHDTETGVIIRQQKGHKIWGVQVDRSPISEENREFIRDRYLGEVLLSVNKAERSGIIFESDFEVVLRVFLEPDLVLTVSGWESDNRRVSREAIFDYIVSGPLYRLLRDYVSIDIVGNWRSNDSNPVN